MTSRVASRFPRRNNRNHQTKRLADRANERRETQSVESVEGRLDDDVVEREGAREGVNVKNAQGSRSADDGANCDAD